MSVTPTDDPSLRESPGDEYLDSCELVRRAQGGEDEALNELFGRYYERVRRIVRLRLGRDLRGALDSGDILQETFAASVRALDRFEMRDDSSLIHWLSKIAEHQIKAAADYHGAQKRDRKRAVPFAFEPDGSGAASGPPEPEDLAPPPIERMVEAEDARALETVLEELRDDYREVILHRDYEGASWETIATWMGSPSPDAARMLYARAVAELSSRVRGCNEP
jgi:RNA polymerase sigma-70 factor (subfamily 1)